MVCEGHSQAQVWFRYGSDPWMVFKADAPLSYTTVVTPPSPGQCPTLYRVYGTCINIFGREVGWESFVPVIAPIKGIKITGNGAPIFPNAPMIDGQPPGQDNLGGVYIGNISQNQQIYYGSRYILPGTYPQITSVVRVDGLPDDCGAASCTFKIFDVGGNVLYERVEPTCPDVLVKCGDACPPETCCECDDGERVCCYGNDGTAIYSFLK